ncbi:MAG: DNA internalization-related competence protein ComEC/Rec2 [Gemmatimonadaceae bacterium]
MPLTVAAFCAYAAGLYLGFGGFLFWGGAACLGAGAIALVARQRIAALLCLTTFGGAVVAHLARRDDASCAQRVAVAGVADIRLLSDLTPHRAGRGVVVAARCEVRVRMLARGGSWAAGSVVRVAGRFRRRGDALEVRDATVDASKPPGTLALARQRAGQRIDTLYGADAPLARALLLADADDIDREVRNRFADAGIIHMLSVSGLHVAIIAGAVRSAASAARATGVVAEGVALAVTFGFVIFIGAPPPALRSAAMLGLGTAAKVVQRPTSAWGIWAVSCAIPLANPHVALDLGWQLSAAGMAGLLASGPLSRRTCASLRGWPRKVADGVLATTLASAVTAPLVAWVFGRVSVAALATNLIAAPLFGVAQPLLFVSLVVAPQRDVALLLAEAARSVLGLLDQLARGAAAVPFAVLRAEPDAMSAGLLGVAAVALVIAAVGRWPRRPALVALGAAVLAAWWPVLAPGPGTLQLHAIDVGQGDAMALRTPRGRWLVVDAGDAWRTGDAGASIVWPYLRHRGGDVVYLSLSHPHRDHIGGAVSLLSRAAVDTVWDGAYVSGSEAYREVLRSARAHRAVWRRVAAGDSLQFDGVTLRVLAPDSAWMEGLRDPNNASVVLQVAYGDVRLLLMGDAEAEEEAWLVRRYGAALRSQVLKVGHHGSATSSTPGFLDQVQPRVALISVGTGNRYGHPSPGVLRELDERGAHLLRTDDDGTVVVETDGHAIRVRANGSEWSYRVGR